MQLILQRSHLVLGLLAAAVATACASTQAPSAPNSAGSAFSSGLGYQSAFENYRAYEEPEPISWQRANDEAGALGGHVGQMKPAGTFTPAPVSKPEDAAGSKKTPAPAVSAPASAAPTRSPTAAPLQKASGTPATAAPASAGHAGHGK